MGSSTGSLTVALTAVLVAWAAVTVAGQGSDQTMSCASKLVGCVSYLNGTTKPPSTCCDPLKEAVTNEKACLCSIYNNPTLIAAYHINVTNALKLPKLCGFDTGKDADICKGLAASPTSSTSSPTGGSTPATGSGSGSGSNAAGTITGTGLLSSLVMFGAYMMFY